MDISIIIVNYNSYELVKNCIKSIIKYLDSDIISYEIIVVDSGSQENDILNICKEYDVKYLECSNFGFGYANNKGAELSTGDLLLFLNPDTYLIDNSIIEMIKCYKVKSYGIISPLIVNEDLTVQYSHDNFHTTLHFIAEAFNLHNYFKNKSISSDNSNKNEYTFKIDWALGAALLISKEIFFKAGKFNERYFLYYEDCDIARKINKMSYINVCFPSCRIVHLLSATSANKSFSKYHVHRSRLIYFSEHLSNYHNIFLRVVFIISLLLRLLFSPFKSTNRETNSKNIITNLKLYFKKADSI